MLQGKWGPGITSGIAARVLEDFVVITNNKIKSSG